MSTSVTDSALEIIRLENVVPEQVQWLWPGRFPLGKISLVIGDPGANKSMLLLDMAARISRGLPWPDRPNEPQPIGGTVIISSEDGVADTISARLSAANADRTKIVCVRGKKRTLNLESDLVDLGNAIDQVNNCRLLVLDPLDAYLGRTDSHKNAPLRSILTPMSALAEEKRVSIIGIGHLNKRECLGIYRSQGSIGYVAQARAVHLVAKYQEQDKRVLLPMKMNLCREPDGLVFYVDDQNGLPAIRWSDEQVTISPDELLAQPANSIKRAPARQDAKDFLAKVLTDAPVHASVVLERAKEAGISSSTLYRARDDLKVKTDHHNFWSLA
jgi:putative DNA primase/helicase